jgi:hypothetical protein
VFRRSKSETAAPQVEESPTTRAEGKGRPTPTRKEAEAAARARAKASARPAKGDRAARAEQSRRIRQGMKEGDPRYLPARDRGPVRKFIRDYVDHRLCMAELAIPLFFISLILSSSGLSGYGAALVQATLLVVVVDSLILRWRLLRELRTRFPDESLSGTTFYALMRALQLRFLRLPKPQVKMGQKLPARY